MMIAAGCDIAALSRQLGHKNIATARSMYGHWYPQGIRFGLHQQSGDRSPHD
jgi:hypothetical protein